MKFKPLKITRLRNDLHFQFHRDIIAAIEEFDADPMRISQLFQHYKACFGTEDLAFKKIVKSAITKQIEEADKVRDEAWSGLSEAVSAASKRPSPELKKRAYELRIVLRNYGDVPRKSFNEESAAIINAVQDLESAKYAAAVAATGVAPWVADLKAANNAFMSLMNARYDEAADKCSVQMRSARLETDEAYKSILEHISAFILAFGKEAYEGFIVKHNLIATKYKAAMAHSGSRKWNEPEELDDEEDT